MKKEELMELEIDQVTQIANDVGVPKKSLKRATKGEIADAIVKILDAQPKDASEAAGDEDDEQDEGAESEEGEEDPAEPAPAKATAPHKAVQNAPEPPLPAPTTTHPSVAEIRKGVNHLVKRGLQIIQLEDDPHPDGHHQWHFRFKNKEAAGTVFQPLRTIVQQAAMLMAPTKVPTEG